MPPLPSTTGLKMFLEAARHESFAKAASALNVTQAAVSKQVALLESRLGESLFERGHRSVTLTEAGHRYRSVAEQVLSLLELGRTSVAAVATRPALRIESDDEFLQGFLVPRLPALRTALPDVAFHFSSPSPSLRRAGPGADLTISYGRPTGQGQGAEVERLVGFRVFAVGARLLVDGVAAPLETLPLLHDLDTRWWSEILAREGVSRTDPAVILGQATISLRAALAGVGLAVGDDLLCGDALASGALVPVGTSRLPGHEDYWLARKATGRDAGTARTFRDWLIGEIESRPSFDDPRALASARRSSRR